MRKVKVLVTHFQARPEELDRIRAVDPRVEAAYALYEDRFALDLVEAFRKGGGSRRFPLGPGDFDREVADAEVILSLSLPKDITSRAPGLRWVQVTGAGMDYLNGTGLLEKGVVITTTAGANAPAVAEYCVLLMLMHAKRLPGRLKAQERHEWKRLPNEELAGKTLGIIGAGHIGQALGQRARAFDMRVLATRRAYVPGQGVPHIDELYPNERLHEMLGRCDYVVAAMSLTAETRGMIGEAELRAMKPASFFINVARGPVVDEGALVRVLKDGHLGGAGLDVFNQEPLPPDSELWDLPNVYISAHNSGGLREQSGRATEQFCANLRRYLAGEPLENAVSPEKGY